MTKLFAFWASHRTELAGLLGQHIVLVVVATTVAAAIGVPLGVFAARRPRLAAPLMAAASIVQTVPSLAMFGFLLPVPLVGGVRRASRAGRADPLRRAAESCGRRSPGCAGSMPRIREAGRGDGDDAAASLLRQVELPLALPSVGRRRARRTVRRLLARRPSPAAIGAGRTRRVHLPRSVMVDSGP
jgi:osmoprotectant transport system permease protein